MDFWYCITSMDGPNTENLPKLRFDPTFMILSQHYFFNEPDWDVVPENCIFFTAVSRSVGRCCARPGSSCVACGSGWHRWCAWCGLAASSRQPGLSCSTLQVPLPLYVSIFYCVGEPEPQEPQLFALAKSEYKCQITKMRWQLSGKQCCFWQKEDFVNFFYC